MVPPGNVLGKDINRPPSRARRCNTDDPCGLQPDWYNIRAHQRHGSGSHHGGLERDALGHPGEGGQCPPQGDAAGSISPATCDTSSHPSSALLGASSQIPGARAGHAVPSLGGAGAAAAGTSGLSRSPNLLPLHLSETAPQVAPRPPHLTPTQLKAADEQLKVYSNLFPPHVPQLRTWLGNPELPPGVKVLCRSRDRVKTKVCPRHLPNCGLKPAVKTGTRCAGRGNQRKEGATQQNAKSTMTHGRQAEVGNNPGRTRGEAGTKEMQSCGCTETWSPQQRPSTHLPWQTWNKTCAAGHWKMVVAPISTLRSHVRICTPVNAALQADRRIAWTRPFHSPSDSSPSLKPCFGNSVTSGSLLSFVQRDRQSVWQTQAVLTLQSPECLMLCPRIRIKPPLLLSCTKKI